MSEKGPGDTVVDLQRWQDERAARMSSEQVREWARVGAREGDAWISDSLLRTVKLRNVRIEYLEDLLRRNGILFDV